MTALHQIFLRHDTLADQLRTACILECTAPKPGNVTPVHAFADTSYQDFIRSAEVVAPILACSSQNGAGRSLRDAVTATRDAVGTNTNLGMLLLLAPLAAIPLEQTCSTGIAAALDGLDMEQTRFIFEAIRLAQPGGLGRSRSHDVTDDPQVSIVAAMALAPHDRIAFQYTHAFTDVLDWGKPRFLECLNVGMNWDAAVVRVHLELLARQSDSLILRKCGPEMTARAQFRAKQTIAAWPFGTTPPEELHQFDAWLRADGHRRNPGTTADLLAAILFAAIRDGDWCPPESVQVPAVRSQS